MLAASQDGQPVPAVPGQASGSLAVMSSGCLLYHASSAGTQHHRSTHWDINENRSEQARH